jgi:DNA repair protein RecO (recombination protein O)
LIVLLLTEDSVPMTFIAKSALKSKKRFGGGVLEPSHCIVATYQQKAGQEEGDRLPVLAEAQLDEAFEGLRSDYNRLELALHFLKLVQKVTNAGDANERSLFNLLGHALRQAEHSTNLSLLKTHFEAKLLEQQGVLPHEPLFRELITHSIREHQSLHLSSDDIQVLRPRIDYILKQYAGF